MPYSINDNDPFKPDDSESGAKQKRFINWGFVALMILVLIIIAIGLTYIPPK